MEVTYVSAFYKIYDDHKDSYLDDYIKFVEKGFKCILYLDKTLPEWTTRLSAYNNVTVIADREFKDLPLVTQFPKAETIITENRNHTKDTYEYMILMNSKLHFVKEALPLLTTEAVAWMDFGINKILKKTDDVFKRLLLAQVPDSHILIPGCVERSPININNINWRFCGGLFFGNKTTIQEFYSLCESVLASLGNNLTWEVNVWALAELTNPQLFRWYKADHNDSIVNFPISGTRKIIVTIMIKNEERIIKRCINSVLNIADAICIADTGSTDGTVKLLEEFLPSLPIPATLVKHEWQNFGHNRTKTFNAAQEYCKTLRWNPETTYSLLVDADMNLVMLPTFDKSTLTATGYRIKQKTPGLEYFNTRFIKIGYPWACVGVTHEYWDGADCEPLDTIYIDDIGDGGCKDDKFLRDERLLKKGLEEEPTNCRYMFYLAQTLKDLKKLPESIEMYKKRTLAGGWYEEIWYSMYIISKLYYELGNLTEMEYWALKAYDINKNRAENIYFLTKIFREKGQHHKAWHYLQIGIIMPLPKELLFLESDVYTHLFHYEKTILNYYILPEKKLESLKELLTYYNNNSGGHTYSNMQFYAQPLKTKAIRELGFPEKDDFIPTSTSICRQANNTYRLNVRYVNYRIQRDGSYLMMKGGNLSRDNNVRTRNFTVLMDLEFQPLSELEEMIVDFPSKHDVHIQGLEDLRIYQDQDLMKWSGTSMEYSHDGRIRQIMGTYNLETKTLQNGVSLIPPTQSDCEKNWIPLGNDEFIYGWKPFTIGNIVETKFITTFKQETPRFFEHVRGSSNIVEYKGSLWTMTHCVMYVTPRKYYHMLMKINKTSRKLEAYSVPFYFKTNHIEYCLGIEIRNETLLSIVSQNDANPILVTTLLSDLTFMQV